MDVNQITALASFIVDCFIIAQIIIIYRHYRYPSLRFLLFGILFLVIADLAPITKYLPSILFGDSVLVKAIEVILRNFAVLSILLVLEASTTQSVFTRRNIFLGVLVVSIATGVLIMASLIKIEETSFYSGLTHIDFTVLTDFSGVGLLFVLYFVLILFLGDALIVGQIVLIILKLTQQKKESPNPIRRKNIQNLQIGCYVLIIGSLFTPILPYIGDILMIFGFLFLIWNIRKSGDLLLYEPTLRYLIAMDQGGLPVFSFSFQIGSLIETEPQDSPLPFDHKDALYSGAMSGISSLISEMVDTKQTVEQIILNRDIVIVRQLLDGKFAVLLFTGRATKMFHDALDKFSNEILPVLETVSPLKTLTPERIHETNQLVAKHFGPNVQSIVK